MQEVSLSHKSLYILGWPGTWMVAYLLLSSPNLLWFFNDPTSPLLLLGLYMVGWQIVGSVLILKSVDPKSTCLKLTCIFVGALIAYFAAFFYWITVPGFIVPFFNNPIGRLIIPSLIVWQLIGTRVLSRCASFWKWVTLFVIFMLPLALIMRIGPIFLMQAQTPAASLAAVMARPGFSDLWKLDAVLTVVFIVVACLSFPGLWSKPLRLETKPLESGT